MSQYLRGQGKGFVALVGSVVGVDAVVLGLNADAVVVLPVGLNANVIDVRVGEISAEPTIVVVVACVIGAGID